MQQLTYDKDRFYLGGEPLRILSGAMHYFRMPRACWRDRLLKLRAMGLNTVETYIAWNVHEPREGEYLFSGERDFAAYLDMAAELGLHALVRPGPYICAEWEFGGFPAWLLRDTDIALRTADPRYLRHVDRYFDALAPILVPRLRENGGNIIGVQLENEYGSYGADKRYLRYLLDGLRRRGLTGCVFTSDGPGQTMLSGGTLPGVLMTANFGSGAAERFPVLRARQPDAPPMCCEFWNGWFDYWGGKHQTRDAQAAARELDVMLSLGGSVNLYMFCGGTNFGFMNGANCSDGRFEPTITSYDYDSPLTEAGCYTPKYHAFRAVIEKWEGLSQAARTLPPEPRAMACGRVELCEKAPLFEQLGALGTPIESPYLLSMEQAGQSTGFILYRTEVRGPADPDCALVLKDVRDRALVFIDGAFCGAFMREEGNVSIPLRLNGGEPARIEILVENMGRVNYGDRMGDGRKGILGGAFLQFQYIPDWEIIPIPLEDLSALSFRAAAGDSADNAPAFWRGTFTAEETADTYLHTAGMGKGVAFINGFNLGRYWDKGPQRTLYIPACLLKKGENQLTLFELHKAGGAVELLDHPILG